MNSTIVSTPTGRETFDSTAVEAPIGAVTWGAIFAGAAGASALSLILLILGVGLGLSSVSPWSGQGVTAATFGVSTVLWLTFTQLAASGMGGYLAGRLRSRWMRTSVDEVYFRDTAHGFLAWAVSSLVTAAMLGSAIGSILTGGAQLAGGLASSVVSTAAIAAPAVSAAGGPGAETQSYFIDALFRRDATDTPTAATAPDVAASSNGSSTQTLPPITAQASAPVDSAVVSAATAEAARIFANAISSGTLPPDDAKYLARRVSQHTGLSQADAEKRVADSYMRLQTKLKEAESAARAAAEKARKASSIAALWTFVSLLIGAFIASLMATFGGRQRDRA